MTAEAVIHDPTELDSYAQQLVGQLRDISSDGATVLALSGDLGAGKTALTKAISGVLGVAQTVTSPTFVIMQRYPLPETAAFRHLVHIDAYRLGTSEELATLDFAELLNDTGMLIVIEWAEQVADALPAGAVWLEIELLPDGSRRITSKL